ncbi:transcriptional regulator, TetR family [Zymomonas mobilis subsp. mobilis NCIMB 11163]|uniref:TetR/AcrR family transcriptional regulator n=1 Tax=Zymomonas mobilis TaxID=542 RepID=UPI0001B707E3|nr:TetR/AcrR family transcriptional regulator [Zymomonas mobilis]ACV76195.1 transcriptional regulator, TetR family [Zymomonas mobilis subsp. mobilis NCIMB 11163]
MARPRTIDRERVLKSAEQLVQRAGATAMTLEAVAKEAGITKGGLQYCFGSKDDLITALIDRWFAAFDCEVKEYSQSDDSPAGEARAYVQASSQIDDATSARIVGMLVTLLQSPNHLKKIQAWYARWMEKNLGQSEEARHIRTMLFAAEGAFFLRSLGFIKMSESEWATVFDDIKKLVPSAQAGRASFK